MALDGIGEKLKSLFKPKEDARFKGQGRKLGSAETLASAGAPKTLQLSPKASTNAGCSGDANVANSNAAENGSSFSDAAGRLKRPPHLLGPGAHLTLSRPTHRTDDIVLDATIMVANTPTGREAQLVAAAGLPLLSHTTSPPSSSRQVSSATGSTFNAGGSSRISTMSTPTAAEKRISGGFRCPALPPDAAMADYGVAPATSQDYELERALALVLSWTPSSAAPAEASGAVAALSAAPAGPRECCEALLLVLRNVLTKPGEAKYRQIRLSNPRVQQTIVGVPGAIEFLEGAGFQMRFTADDGSNTANQGILVLPDQLPASALAEPFRVLSAVMAAHGYGGAAQGLPQQQHQYQQPHQAAGEGSGAAEAAEAVSAPELSSGQTVVVAVPAVDRRTQVLLPAAPDTEVPEWFFERTGAEIRAQWHALVSARQQADQLMTRTMRDVRRQQQMEAEAEAADRGTGSPDVAAVRVRFPEGVCLQGNFGASEPITRVFEWVAAALRSPHLTFELIQPNRQPLLATGLPAATTTSSKASASAASSRPRPLTVRSAGLLPSVLLNLRPTGSLTAQLLATNIPLLSDEMLATTRPQ